MNNGTESKLETRNSSICRTRNYQKWPEIYNKRRSKSHPLCIKFPLQGCQLINVCPCCLNKLHPGYLGIMRKWLIYYKFLGDFLVWWALCCPPRRGFVVEGTYIRCLRRPSSALCDYVDSPDSPLPCHTVEKGINDSEMNRIIYSVS